MIIYGWFEFFIDAGSSLGLWLGLSALGIWDLIVEYTRKFKSFFIVFSSKAKFWTSTFVFSFKNKK